MVAVAVAATAVACGDDDQPSVSASDTVVQFLNADYDGRVALACSYDRYFDDSGSILDKVPVSPTFTISGEQVIEGKYAKVDAYFPEFSEPGSFFLVAEDGAWKICGGAKYFDLEVAIRVFQGQPRAGNASTPSDAVLLMSEAVLSGNADLVRQALCSHDMVDHLRSDLLEHVEDEGVMLGPLPTTVDGQVSDDRHAAVPIGGDEGFTAVAFVVVEDGSWKVCEVAQTYEDDDIDEIFQRGVDIYEGRR